MNNERHLCPGCGYVYEARRGDPHNGFAPGTVFSELPADWCCPDCAVREKPDFELLSAEAA